MHSFILVGLPVTGVYIGQLGESRCVLACLCRPDAVHGRPGPVTAEVRQRYAGQCVEDHHGRLRTSEPRRRSLLPDHQTTHKQPQHTLVRFNATLLYN